MKYNSDSEKTFKQRKIELLAPAKNIECGIAAIDHGADAVYIGAPLFSARATAGNSIEDIKNLASYAHLFGAKIYVALNTILNDKELEQAEMLIWQLWDEAKVDALIVQDMGILQLNLPPIPLHASTQMDTRTVDKAKFLENTGFQQVVLARELSLTEIKNISENISVPLEAFVHGALCVCYSGQCYLSQALSGRSANKGACAQYCRLPYDLVDSQGEKILSKKHLLSMKDLNLSEDLEAMMDAGVSSLKIEGRLKDISYVKNTVAYYRKKIDNILAKRPEFKKASSGTCTFDFKPQLDKSFNRGFTQYFLNGREKDSKIWSIDSPKSIGEYIGTVKNITNKFAELKTDKQLNNGDGLCYFNNDGELQGVQVNRVESNKIYPFERVPDLKSGTKIYRNYDHEFEKIIQRNNTAERKIGVNIVFEDTSNGYLLTATDEDNISVFLEIKHTKELAKKDQAETIKNNLKKTGNTIFSVIDVQIVFSQPWFIPSSALSEWRRLLIEKLEDARKHSYQRDTFALQPTSHPFPLREITYLGNVMNKKSENFYIQHQATVIQPAFEKQSVDDVPLMFTRHCIKQSLGWCPKEGPKSHPYQEPFFLKYNNTNLQLVFDCKLCEMKIFNVK